MKSKSHWEAATWKNTLLLCWKPARIKDQSHRHSLAPPCCWSREKHPCMKCSWSLYYKICSHSLTYTHTKKCINGLSNIMHWIPRTESTPRCWWTSLNPTIWSKNQTPRQKSPNYTCRIYHFFSKVTALILTPNNGRHALRDIKMISPVSDLKSITNSRKQYASPRRH